jgi:hypothetical protein
MKKVSVMPFFRWPSNAAERPHRGRENRKAPRRKVSAAGWIRLEGGFAVRSCKIVDLSTTGVQINVNSAEMVPTTFSFLETRTGHGRRARVIRRRGSQIGAEFE